MRVMVVEDDWTQETTTVHDFGSKGKQALAFLGERERALFPWDGPQRVCYFRADAVNGLRKTHGNWFHRYVTVISH